MKPKHSLFYHKLLMAGWVVIHDRYCHRNIPLDQNILQYILSDHSFPIQEMVDACAEHPGAALILSISSASDVTTTSKQLKRLRDALPQEIPILVGGEGLPQRSPIPGIQPIKSLLAFEEWVTERKG